MGSEWSNTTIGDQITLQRGFDITRKEQRPGKVPVISSGGISSYHDTAKQSGPGVVMGRKGSLGTVFYVEDDYWPHDTTLWIKDFHGNDERFAYYFFKNIAPQLLDMDVGAANPTLNRNHVHPIEIRWPSLPEQKAIAHILGTLDDKIELNRRMNATLEGMAQALFKSWFVDFDPVIDNALAAGNPIPAELAPRAEVRKKALAEGTTQQGSVDHPTLSDPKSLFPAAFELTEELGWIPEGWDLTTVGKHVSLQRGTTYKSKLKGFPGPFLLGLGAIQRNGGFKEDKLVTYGGESPEKITLGPGDIFVSLKDLTQAAALLGSVARIPPHIPSGRLTQDTVALVFDKEPISKDYLYNALLTPRYRDYCSSYATGTTNLGLAREDFFSFPIPNPSEQVQKYYDTFVLGNQEKHQVNTAEANSLSKLRDTLLPKLISGELHVSRSEPQLEEALS